MMMLIEPNYRLINTFHSIEKACCTINGMNLVTCASKLKVVRGIPGQLI